jgi:hypothetical protein
MAKALDAKGGLWVIQPVSIGSGSAAKRQPGHRQQRVRNRTLAVRAAIGSSRPEAVIDGPSHPRQHTANSGHGRHRLRTVGFGQKPRLTLLVQDGRIWPEPDRRGPVLTMHKTPPPSTVQAFLTGWRVSRASG